MTKRGQRVMMKGDDGKAVQVFIPSKPKGKKGTQKPYDKEKARAKSKAASKSRKKNRK